MHFQRRLIAVVADDGQGRCRVGANVLLRAVEYRTRIGSAHMRFKTSGGF
jgi:hypothetical protein